MSFFRRSLSLRLRLRSAIPSAGAGCLVLLAVPFCAAANPPASRPAISPWVATWGAAMMATDPGGAPNFTGQTLRQIVHTSVGGPRVRVWLSNRFGTEPLQIGAAHVAISVAKSSPASATPDTATTYAPAEASAVQPGSDHALTFHHMSSVVIPPGATIVSDPVDLDLPSFANLAVSLYFPSHTMGATEHDLALQTSYAASGNAVDAANLGDKAWREGSWYFLSGVDVDAPGDSSVIAFGDSITDGWQSTDGENHRWPDVLATRLAADTQASTAGVLGVVNLGISGNRVLLDGAGPNAVSRTGRDIVARSGARFLIVLESINDIGRVAEDHQPYGDLAARLEAGLAQIAAQAHQHNMIIIGATMTPYQGCGYYSPAGEAVRQAVNQWIRTSPTFDGIADFDKAVRDPQNPLRFATQYDSGDHLHPKDAGYQAMANAIDLSLLTRKR